LLVELDGVINDEIEDMVIVILIRSEKVLRDEILIKLAFAEFLGTGGCQASKIVISI
jgi:hypothetical protein